MNFLCLLETNKTSALPWMIHRLGVTGFLCLTSFLPIAQTGGCKWIRIPAIVYSTHVATTLIPILAHILFYQFPLKPNPGPQTVQERWLLVSIYAPYLLVPVLLLLTMLMSSTYNASSKPGNVSAKAKKKNWSATRQYYLIYCDFKRSFSTFVNVWTCMCKSVWVTPFIRKKLPSWTIWNCHF